MQAKTIQEQMESLRSLTMSSHAMNIRLWLLGGAMAAIALGLILWHPVPVMIGVFLGLPSLAERNTMSNIAAAVRAFDTAEPTTGEVEISAVYDSSSRFHARVTEKGQRDWDYEFIASEWNPEEGVYPARVWRRIETNAPILSTVQGGILVPRRDAVPSPTEAD